MNPQPPPQRYSYLNSFLSWFGAAKPSVGPGSDKFEQIDWIRSVPFIFLHVACLGVFFVGWSWLAVSVAVFFYALRVFTLTGFYHRYFSHRTFKTSRVVQFIFGGIGCMAVQRGPLWWAAHHRHHHIHSDDPHDLHSPRQHGILWSHFGWFLTPKAAPTDLKIIPDFAKYPELRWLDKYDLAIVVAFAASLFGFGALVGWGAPESGVTGMQMLVWGFFISTIFTSHVTYLVNSATHLIGTRRYKTKDDSKNSLIVALLTFGEGWHNNHHYYPNSTRQGFFWWEIDMSYYIIWFMGKLGLVWDIHPVPMRIMYPKPSAMANAPATPEANPSCALPS